MNLSIGILAGGKSKRMGKDKAFLKISGETFLHKIINELKSLGKIYISVDDKKKFEIYDEILIEDKDKNIGPLEGIKNLLKNSQEEYMFICATDMPFLKKELINYMKEFISSDFLCYSVSYQDKTHPLCAIYSKKLIPIIENSIKTNNFKLRELLSKTSVKYIHLESSCFSPKIITNINYPNEYLDSIKPFVFCVSGVKNSGKTSLICKLILELKSLGYKTSVIKHDSHDFVIDHEGTDSYKFKKSSAEEVLVFSEKKYALISSNSGKNINYFVNKLEQKDFIIIEGMKNSIYPKIEVVRKNVSVTNVCDSDFLIATATDIENYNFGKILNLNDSKKIVEEIINYFENI